MVVGCAEDYFPAQNPVQYDRKRKTKDRSSHIVMTYQINDLEERQLQQYDANCDGKIPYQTLVA
jgi:hypothetical protein